MNWRRVEVVLPPTDIADRFGNECSRVVLAVDKWGEYMTARLWGDGQWCHADGEEHPIYHGSVVAWMPITPYETDERSDER